jgi:Flp pilus assembly protein TadG
MDPPLGDKPAGPQALRLPAKPHRGAAVNAAMVRLASVFSRPRGAGSRFAERGAQRGAGRATGRGAERGVAALEFALLLPLLSMIFVGTIDASRLIAQSYRAQGLAQAAARAAARLPDLPAAPHSGAPTSAGWPTLPGLSVASLVTLPPGAQGSTSLFWACGGTDAQLVPAATPECPPGIRPAGYVRVDLDVPVRYVLAWPDLVLPPVARVSALARIG